MAHRRVVEVCAVLVLLWAPSVFSMDKWGSVGPGAVSADQWELMESEGREVLSSVPGMDMPLGGSNEPTIAVNPIDPSNLAYATGSLRVSTDAGMTWQAAVPPDLPDPSPYPGTYYSPNLDPSVAFDSQGRLFWTYLGILKDSDDDSNIGYEVFVAQCNPATGTILEATNVTVQLGIPAIDGHFNDKEWMAIDQCSASPYRDRLYVVWSLLEPATFSIVACYSNDQGRTWALSGPLPLSVPAEGKVWPPHITVAPNGDVYVAYHSQTGFDDQANGRLPDGETGQVIVCRSTDGGATYPQKTAAYGPGEADITWNVQHLGNTIPNTQFWLQGSSQPWILADPNIPGRLYVVANDDTDDDHSGGDQADVYIAISNDDGMSWGAPRRIDDGPGTTFQVMPTAGIDPLTGTIVVHYYDNRNDDTNAAGNYLLDVFATVSTDGGLTFDADFQINDVPFDPDPGAPCRFQCDEGDPGPKTFRIGEYNGVAAAGGTGFAVWCGNRFDGGGNPTGQQTFFDTFAAGSAAGGFALDQVDNEFDPPNPWVQDGLVIDFVDVVAGADLLNVRFFSDPLQCADAPCETGGTEMIHAGLIQIVPEEIAFLPAGETVSVEIKKSIPVGQHACTYVGNVHLIAHTRNACQGKTEDELVLTLTVHPTIDMDVDDNHGNVSDNVLHLNGAKETTVSGTYTVVNPNSEGKNVDLADGPGNIRIVPVGVTTSDLVKVGDPAVAIPSGNITMDPLDDLASGESQDVRLSVHVPDGIPVNAVYEGTIEVSYESCLGGETVSDEFTLQINVLPTQGTLDIVEDVLDEDFCPDDPWIMVGQVEFTFNIHANGDHRNVRLSSGGLRHETLDKKLDDFNFFPEEFALIAAGETREARVIVKIPIGQHAGLYTGVFRVVSENGGEDEVVASIDICPIYDLDIKDGYANLGDNVMEIPAYSRANQSGGEWALRAFDIGLPADLIGNHDEFDGPGNVPIDCITCEFGPWSPAWRHVGNEPQLHNNFEFTGYGTVTGELCDWQSGEFRRLLVGVFVPRMNGGHNHPGIYRGRLDCVAMAGGGPVAEDHFDLELQLSRVVGSGHPLAPFGSFGAEPTPLGARLYWGDFTTLGMEGEVNLYRESLDTGEVTRIQASLPQASSYVDEDIDPQSLYNYRLGVEYAGGEFMVGPVSVGGIPARLELGQNFPNPFRDQTAIDYNLPTNGQVRLQIYDVTGRLVRTLVNGEEYAGFYSVDWDRRSNAGQRAASGIYYYRLTTTERTETRKMVVTQ